MRIADETCECSLCFNVCCSSILLFVFQLDDLNLNFESTRGTISSLEKKQKKFDAQLQEQHALAEKNASERDAAEARARQAETKALSLTHELEELQDKLEEVERIKKTLMVRYM